jgi:hypothetical protein
MRYECAWHTTDVEVIDGAEIGEAGKGLALVIGDPEATALAVFGTRDELIAFLDRARQAVEAQ